MNEDSGDRFLFWKTLTAENLALTVSPNHLMVKEVRVQEPGAKIVVAKDRSVSILQVLKRRGDAQASAPPSRARSDRFPVRVARVGLQQGTLDFADNSLVLPFATRVNFGLDGLERKRRCERFRAVFQNLRFAHSDACRSIPACAMNSAIARARWAARSGSTVSGNGSRPESLDP